MATALPDSGVHPSVCAPAVRYPLARPRGLRRLLLLLWAMAIAVHGYWLAVAPVGDWRPWLGVVVALVAGALAWRAGPMAQAGVLVWDGACWWWERASTTVAGRVAVRLDVQSGLLLRFVADSGSACWFWLERHGSPVHEQAPGRSQVFSHPLGGPGEARVGGAHWLALRRAAHAASDHDGASSPADRNRTVIS